LEAALDVLGLIALKGKVVTADALHCNRRTVAAITGGGGDYYLALKANQDSLLSDARSCFGKVPPDHPVAHNEEAGHGRKEARTGTVVSAKGLADQHEFPGLQAFGRIGSRRETDGKVQTETRHFAPSRVPAPEVFMATVTPCIGNLTFRSGKMPPATARTMVPPTSPSCAAALSISPAATPPKARSRSN
jgi:predicted transposase YbfD/YdcC